MPEDTNLDRAIYDALMNLFPGIQLGIPVGVGNVFWVDSVAGDNGNVGTRPDQAFATIIYALTQCTNNNNDYIMVIRSAEEAATITVGVSRVHIIGLGNFFRPNSNHPYVELSAGGDWAIFTLTDDSDNCEIAGFSLGGGATAAGIQNLAGTPEGIHIHDCVFGHAFIADTPQDGIFIDLNATNIRIEHCTFLGIPGGKGTITRDGIRWDSGANPLNGAIENNQLKGLPGIAINFVALLNDTGGITIKDNLIVMEDGYAVGDAINLAATVRGFMVVGNKAMYGQATAAMVNNPYLDSCIAAPFNSWGQNSKGNVLVDPA